MKTIFRAVFLAGIIVVSLQAVSAATIVTANNNSNTDNVLYNACGAVLGPATVVQGCTQNGFLIDYKGENVNTGVSLIAIGGQAKIRQSNDGVNFGTFTSLSITPNDPLVAFQKIVFIVTKDGPGGGTQPTITFNLTFYGGATQQTILQADSSGYFTITAQNAELIRQVVITSNILLEDIRQVRIGGIDFVETGVPEPSSALLSLAGGLFVALGAYKRSVGRTSRSDI